MKRPILINEPATAPATPTPGAPQRAVLVLEDGRAFLGESLGASGSVCGEVVFNTAMTGYQEVLTDPSYTGQLVTLTHPHIGNTGLQPNDGESSRPRLSGLIVSKATKAPSHPHSVWSLEGYLRHHDVIGIEGLDTRALVRHVRSHGAMPAMITTDVPQSGPWGLDDATTAALTARVNAWSTTRDLALALRAGTQRPYTIEGGEHASVRGRNKVIVAFDFGLKMSIVHQLAALGCKVHVVPASFPAEAVRAMKPDGIFLSNGPGDPRALPNVIETVVALLGEAPIFGICLGHQLLALALGGAVEKLPFGHRGANHPVLEVETGRIEITSQNHGYHVIAGSLPEGSVATHVNLNDGTLEGLEHKSADAFSVQYHPEACPGPHDAHSHFLRFLDRTSVHRS